MPRLRDDDDDAALLIDGGRMTGENGRQNGSTEEDSVHPTLNMAAYRAIELCNLLNHRAQETDKNGRRRDLFLPRTLSFRRSKLARANKSRSGKKEERLQPALSTQISISLLGCLDTNGLLEGQTEGGIGSNERGVIPSMVKTVTIAIALVALNTNTPAVGAENYDAFEIYTREVSITDKESGQGNLHDPVVIKTLDLSQANGTAEAPAQSLLFLAWADPLTKAPSLPTTAEETGLVLAGLQLPESGVQVVGQCMPLSFFFTRMSPPAQAKLKLLLQPGKLQPKYEGPNSPAGLCFDQHGDSSESAGISLEMKVSVSHVGPSVSGPQAHRVWRPPKGRAVFHYNFNGCDNNVMEGVENSMCPFCLLKCGSFQGLELHLRACHLEFKYVFSTDGVTNFVEVSTVDAQLEEKRNAHFVRDSDEHPFFHFSSRTQKRKLQQACEYPKKVAHELSDQLTRKGVKEDTSRPPPPNAEESVTEVVNRRENIENKPEEASENVAPGGGPKVVKLAAGAVVQVDRRSAVIKGISQGGEVAPGPVTEALQRTVDTAVYGRPFFHSQTAQAMPLEDLLSDHDSEDDDDQYLADLEDKRLLEEFLDVSQEEKSLMHLWNSFVRKQRVIADGHMPWACTTFARMYADKLGQSTALRRSFHCFLMKCWNFNLIEGSVVDKCLQLVDSKGDQ